MQYFYCYSPLLMHYLKACKIQYVAEGYNPNTKSAYFQFERCARLDKALNGWEEFKQKQMEEQQNGE